MIKNERQYRITRAQAEKFKQALTQMAPELSTNDVHPILRRAQINALRSQLSDLLAELSEYEALKNGQTPVLELDSFEELPRALIKARIASGLTQEELAKKLNLKEQQIQRYEATEYKSASLARVAEVTKALGVKFRKEIFLSGVEFSMSVLLRRLTEAGLDTEFLLRRILPKPPGILLTSERQREARDTVALAAAESIRRIFGWTPGDLFGPGPLGVAPLAGALARFKLPARVKEGRLAAYVLYAHYLAMLVLHATEHLETRPIPIDAEEARKAILKEHKSINFETTLKYVWSLGIPVLPLNDPGVFHGACWRVGRRNVIVLKQRTSSEARWLHDLLHELRHSGREPNLEEHPLIEEDEMSDSRRQSPEEVEASRFAGDVVLDCRAEEVVEACVKAAQGSVERLKAVLPKIAKQEGLPVDALANYMAFRLSLQGINWWGAATNLQRVGVRRGSTPRDLLLENIDLARLNEIDRDLLLRALEPLVLAFSGRMGSGKSQISAEVAKALGWPRASFGDYIRSVARSEGLKESREVLQEIGGRLVDEDVEEFCRSVLAHFKWTSGEPLILDGLRHSEVAEIIRKLVAPLDLRIVYLDVDDAVRKERLEKRGTGHQALEMAEQHTTEVQVKTVLPDLADLTLSGDRSPEDLVREIVAWIHQGDGVANR